MPANIKVVISESIATLTVDRPAVKNALDLATVNEIHQALDKLSSNAEVGVVIITGAGETSFVSGADINDIRARTRDDGLAAINSSLFAKIDKFPKKKLVGRHSLESWGYRLGIWKGDYQEIKEAEAKARDDVARQRLRQEVKQLTLPEAMGERFQAIGFARDVEFGAAFLMGDLSWRL